MIHIDEFVLNEYADEALPTAEAEAVAWHLAVCPACQARLAALQTLFATLENVAEVPITADLSQKILAEIEPQSWWWARWVIAAQVITAVLLAMLLWPATETWFTPSASLADEVTAWWAQLSLYWDEVWVGATAVWEQGQTATPSLNLPTEQWLWLMGLALLVWLVGNGLLLKPQRSQTT